jgi:hypothetical protein
LGVINTNKNNAWKLGGVKYTKSEYSSQNNKGNEAGHVDAGRVGKDDKNRGMLGSWWINSKPSNSSLDTGPKTKSWWSKKSSSALGRESSTGFYDSFHVW